MLKEQVSSLQPVLYERFSRVLEAGQLGHAYLFSGAFASYETALFLAQAVFCKEHVDGLPCGCCRSCRLIEQEEFSDVTVLAPKGNLIKTETIRDLVKDFSRSGFESERQVFIIRDAEKMHPNAANSLLKAMEEPQSRLHIFLLTNQEEAILPTIKSRSQQVFFPKQIGFLQNLLEKEGVLTSQARILADLANTPQEAIALSGDSVVSQQVTLASKLVDLVTTNRQQAYLEVSRLVQLSQEKREQERLFAILSLLLAQNKREADKPERLAALLEARHMWQHNVSLQNALEYWVLKLR